MSLNFGQKLEGLFPDLNGTRLAFFTDTSEDSFVVGKNLNLAESIFCVTAILSVSRIPNLSIVLGSHDYSICSGAGYVCDAEDCPFSHEIFFP